MRNFIQHWAWLAGLFVISAGLGLGGLSGVQFSSWFWPIPAGQTLVAAHGAACGRTQCTIRVTIPAELAPVEGADIHTGLWCATCAKPSAVSLDTAVYVAGTTTKLRNIHLHYCTDCGADLTGDAS